MCAYTCKWGIMATGGIASLFAKDLLADPKAREVQDVRHEIASVASSSSTERAKEFVHSIGAPSSTKCYNSYDELVNDPDVQIIYVATPHVYHYENCRLALNAGKSVLCEKPFTVNAQQTEHLIEIARQKKIFIMEGIWTRFFPLSKELQRLLFEERILGKIHRVFADFGLPFDIRNLPKGHRILDPELGGGALLDLGIYCLTWIFMIAFADPDNKRKVPLVKSNMLKTPITGIDEFTDMSLTFIESHVTAVMTTNITVKSDEEAICRIQGDKGEVTVQWSPFRPESFTIYRKSQLSGEDAKPTAGYLSKEVRKFDIPGTGLFWEADECARCLRDGELESHVMPLDESLIVMRIMDQARKVNDLKYSERWEAVLH